VIEPPTAALDPTPVAPRLLVVAEDLQIRSQLAQLGREKLLGVVAVGSAGEALAQARRGRLDAAVIDGSLGGEADRLVGRLRSLPGLEALPVAVLSDLGDVEHRVSAAHAGASLFLRKPVDPYAFGAALDQMLALGRGERMRLLIVDDDLDFATSVAAVLERDATVVRTLPDATHLIDTLDETRPDLVLLDAMLPGVSGWDALRVVRTTPEWRDLPVLLVTGRTDVDARVAAFEAGADDYIAKPLVPEELLARVRVRLLRRRLLREMTERDPLTHCLSRRALLDSFASRLSEARRHGGALSVALLDLDRFKLVNDTYGHLVGDQVLMRLGALLNERFRLEDLRGRWGGEEFAIVFPSAPPAAAVAVLSRVLEEFRQVSFLSERGERFFVTFSAGISSFPADGTSVHALLRAADQRLYDAKRGGRGHVAADAARAKAS
jgi:diguanylate cyclase (GGDEF)-like protein